MIDLPETRFLAGMYRITARDAFGNVKRNRKTRKWEADIRNNDGDIIQFAGIWETKRDAVEEVQRILRRYN